MLRDMAIRGDVADLSFNGAQSGMTIRGTSVRDAGAGALPAPPPLASRLLLLLLHQRGGRGSGRRLLRSQSRKATEARVAVHERLGLVCNYYYSTIRTTQNNYYYYHSYCCCINEAGTDQDGDGQKDE